MVGGIYQFRAFVLKDHCSLSSQRGQESGMAQSSPLSPYLFILVQTVLLHDVDARLAGHFRDQRHLLEGAPYAICTELLYADDTLLLSSSAAKLQAHMDLVIDEGARYGLEINWSKTVAININNTGGLLQPSGVVVKKVSQGVYLGGMLTSTAAVGPELSRRLGEAKASFQSLQRCWSHANISRRRKIELYHACVVSKLSYGLDSMWLLSRELRRLDAFHIRCLRCICRIEPSYISRVSNAIVLETAGQAPFSTILRHRQLALYEQTVRMDDDNPLRGLTCEAGSDRPKVWAASRRRGRPKQQWAPSVYCLRSQI